MKKLRTLARYFLVVGLFIGLVVAFSTLFEWANIALPPFVTASIWGVEVFVDWGTTILLLGSGLGIREANPVHAFLFRRVGYAGDFLVMCAFLAVIFVFIWPGVPRSDLLGLCCAYTLVYVNNGLVYRRKLRAKRRAEQYVNLAMERANEPGERGYRD
ncbi:MAG TPA: hypothetical protein VMW64_10405 [Dehalococcoidia bacterium]|nr:hypothetical protein [Dehalococcoidia bacterium]